MDSENRHRMNSLMQQGKWQRNIGKEIGVPTSETCLTETKQEEFVPDWGGDVGADESSHAGVTAGDDHKASSSNPRRAFSIATFGCQKLAHAFPDCRPAHEIEAMWRPTKGLAPQAIPDNVITKAMVRCWHIPDVIVDARLFRPDSFREAAPHIGHSITLCKQLVKNYKFHEFWKGILESVFQKLRGVTPIRIAIFCRAGEKDQCRSLGC